MRNRLLILASLLALLYFVGGPEALQDALVRLFVLAGLQVATNVLEQERARPLPLKKKKRTRELNE